MLLRKIIRYGAAVVKLLLVAGVVILFLQGWLVPLLAQQSPHVVYFAETQEPVVALTIDDGPDPVNTTKILDILKQHHAQATFFLITNYIPGNEAIVTRIVAEKHELGNHLTADWPSIRLPLPKFEQQLVEAHRVLSSFDKVRWFRPGSGWYNANMLSIVQKHNYQIALGSVYPFDPQIPSSHFMTRHILRYVQPGSIIIVHDYGSRGERTALALATILPELNKRGFRVVTLSELVDLQTHGE